MITIIHPIKLFLFVFVGFSLFAGCKKQQLATLPMPTDIQYKWHEQERIMFVCIDPCTWQGREYDNHSVSLDRINPSRLNTDQWCKAALSWGAKEILFVAKHTGGFCWWQTETTDYGIRNTPYKNGEGDVLKELSESCKKHGLNLGIYVYPGDETWGAGIGSGGQTKDPSKQEAYNQVFRQQLTEVLSNYGQAIEIWFDGSCVIDVSDIIAKYGKNSVVFQGPHASLRWPGTESGKLFYPAWNSVRSEDMNTGVSTQIHGNPNGEVWAPLETNTTLYDHYWFWAPWKEEKRKSIDALMECYYKSVGYGSVFLLNSTPDTTGLIPAADIAHYKAFGKEIDRRFSTPVAELKDQEGKEIILQFPESKMINHVIIMEDYRYGERIREYRVDGLVGGQWIELINGNSVGRKKIDYFNDVEATAIHLHVSESAARPLIRSIAAYYVEDFVPFKSKSMHVWANPIELYQWTSAQLRNGQIDIKVDLSKHINVPGQYTIQVVPDVDSSEITLTNIKVYYEGREALKEFATVSGNEINVNRTAQVIDESSSVVTFTLETAYPVSGKVMFKPTLIF